MPEDSELQEDNKSKANAFAPADAAVINAPPRFSQDPMEHLLMLFQGEDPHILLFGYPFGGPIPEATGGVIKDEFSEEEQSVKAETASQKSSSKQEFYEGMTPYEEMKERVKQISSANFERAETESLSEDNSSFVEYDSDPVKQMLQRADQVNKAISSSEEEQDVPVELSWTEIISMKTVQVAPVLATGEELHRSPAFQSHSDLDPDPAPAVASNKPPRSWRNSMDQGECPRLHGHRRTHSI